MKLCLLGICGIESPYTFFLIIWLQGVLQQKFNAVEANQNSTEAYMWALCKT